MELAPYLDSLRRDLTAAAAPGGDDVARAAELLGGSLEASARMCLLEALSDAAAEITTRLDNTSVEVRLRGREAQFVVTSLDAPAPAAPQPAAGPSAPPVEESGDIARLTLRLPEGLKDGGRAGRRRRVDLGQRLAGPGHHPGSARPGRIPAAAVPAPTRSAAEPGRGRMGRRVTGFAQA